MSKNQEVTVDEVWAEMITTFLGLVEQGGVREGVAGMYRLAAALPAAQRHFPVALATMEKWLGEHHNDTSRPS